MSNNGTGQRLVHGFFKLLWRLVVIVIYGFFKLLGELALAIAELFKRVLS